MKNSCATGPLWGKCWFPNYQNMEDKVCTRCKKTRSLDKFNVNKKTGISNKTCTECSEKDKCIHKRQRSKEVEFVSTRGWDQSAKTVKGVGSAHTRGRDQARCKDCKGSGICHHQRRMSYCKDCKGSQICPHERQRSRCKDCKGNQICPYKRVRSYCKECDLKGHLAHIVRSRVSKALQSDEELRSQDYFGCSIAILRAHLESQFKNAMSWDNYDDWNIDHQVPLRY